MYLREKIIIVELGQKGDVELVNLSQWCLLCAVWDHSFDSISYSQPSFKVLADLWIALFFGVLGK